jgi:hypothetical protein
VSGPGAAQSRRELTAHAVVGGDNRSLTFSKRERECLLRTLDERLSTGELRRAATRRTLDLSEDGSRAATIRDKGSALTFAVDDKRLPGHV